MTDLSVCIVSQNNCDADKIIIIIIALRGKKNSKILKSPKIETREHYLINSIRNTSLCYSAVEGYTG